MIRSRIKSALKKHGMGKRRRELYKDSKEMIAAAEEDSETEAEKVRKSMKRRGSLKVSSNRLT